MPYYISFTFALLGGILPALLWLWFWLREDKNPEPKRLIIWSFVAGMSAVIFVFPIEIAIKSVVSSTIVITILWAICEEVFKFGAAYFSGLSKKDNDEPIDPLIYLITAALGFSAIENTLFILNPLMDGNAIQGFLTGDLRFLGASLLHVISSASIGIFMGFSFFKNKYRKGLSIIAGLFVAIALHSAFNWNIMNSDGSNLLSIFSIVWFAVAILMVFFEKIKRIKK